MSASNQLLSISLVLEFIGVIADIIIVTILCLIYLER